MTHFIDDLVDEISLEGLDGITIATLWLRLGDRQPLFKLPLDDEDVKLYLWDCICKVEDLAFYVLPEPRDDVILWDRFKEVPGENDINFDKQDDKIVDLYPVQIIDENGIKGSCQTYHTRKNVTSTICKEDGQNMSLTEVLEKWGRSLVIVASQEKREEALLRGVVLKSPLDSRQYAILERVGRGRWNGSVTHGPKNLLAVIKESRSLFYVRKALQALQTITVQSFGIKNHQGKMLSSKCVHLIRFGRERKTTAQNRLEILTKLLDSKPDKRALLSEIRDEMGIDARSFKKLYDFGKRYLESKLVAYIEMFPDAKASEYMYKGGQSERYLRVLQLLKVYNSNAEEREEEGDGEEAEEEDIGSDAIDRSPRCLELSLTQQGYEVLRDEPCGVTEQEMTRALNIAKLEGRTLCRDLTKLKMTVTMMKDVGRCRVIVYICDDLAKNSRLHEQIQEEKSKMLQNLGAEGNDAVLKSLSDSGLHKRNPAIVKIEGPKHEPKSPLTYRILRRTNIILRHVQENRLIDNMLWLRKKVDEDAQNDTQKFTPFDKKGLWRLLKLLHEEKQIKLIKKKITVGEKSKEAMFVCEPTMGEDDSLVHAAVDAVKMRMVALSKSSRHKMEELNTVQEEDQETPDHNLLRSQVKKAEMIHDARAGARYGFQSRMNRCKLTHQLLFYQVYDYCSKQKEKAEDDSTYMNVDSTYVVTEESVDDDIYDVDRLKVYVEDLTFRRFIPPMRKYPGYEQGWCLLGDIVLHMPVYVFCQIFRVNFKIPALEDFLKHPIRRLVPVSTLPPFIRQQLLYDRKFLHSFFQLCLSLAEMGLLSIGKKNYREKEQVFLYVHRYATILDTTDLSIPPAEWPVKRFHLQTFHDVNHYWFMLNYICMNTPIAIVQFSTGKHRLSNVERVERFKRAHVEYTPETLIDDGHLPGDKLGAGGQDSTNWCHLRKNWVKEKNQADGPVETPLRTMNKAKKRNRSESETAMVGPPAKKGKTVGTGAKKDEGTCPEKEKGNARKRKASESVSPKNSGKDSNKSSRPASKAKLPTKSKIEVPLPPKSKQKEASVAKSQDARAVDLESNGANEEKSTETEMAKRPKPCFKVDSVRGAVSAVALEKRRREKLANRKREKPEEKREKFEFKVRRPRKRRTTGAPDQKRKRFVDVKDQEALKRMTKFRVKWTVKEDSCLLLFQVASKILGGTGRRGTILSGALLRDFMHENFKESLDKTTKACLRRLHYLMKNSATVANVNMYLGEALTDKELMRGVRPQRNFKICEHDQTNKTIVELVQKLREKFKDQGVRKKIDLPNTLDEINSRFYISQVVETLQHDEPETVEDIEKGVLNNLIHAALLLSEKSNYTPILYNVLETYPEKALLDVLATMKRNFMITKVKRTKEVTFDSSLPNGNLGIYQLAQRYSYKWLSKYPPTLFASSYDWMKKFFHEENRKYFAPEGPGMSYAEESGCVAAAIGLVAQRKMAFEVILPENILISHPSEVSIRRKMREKEKLQCQKTESDEEEEALIDSLSHTSDQKTRFPPLCSRRCVSELRFQAQISARKSMINCLTSDYVMVRCAIRFKPLIGAGTPSKPPLRPNSSYEADQILLKFNQENPFLHPKSCSWIVSQLNSCQPCKLNHHERWDDLSVKLRLSEAQIDVCQQIFDQINEAEELGITYMRIWMKHGHKVSFERCLSALQETKLVLSVGVFDKKYVSHVHSHPWLVRSYKNADANSSPPTIDWQYEDGEEFEEMETEVPVEESVLPKDMWTVKPISQDSYEVGLLWKSVSVMYEETPADEATIDEEANEESGSTEAEQQQPVLTEEADQDATQGDSKMPTEITMEIQDQREVENVSPPLKMAISSSSSTDVPSPCTPKKQSVDLSSLLILTPPAPGKILELSLRDGKLVPTVVNKERVKDTQPSDNITASKPQTSDDDSTQTDATTVTTTGSATASEPPIHSSIVPTKTSAEASSIGSPSSQSTTLACKEATSAGVTDETQKVPPMVPPTNAEEIKTIQAEVPFTTRNETAPAMTSSVMQMPSQIAPNQTSQILSSNRLMSGLKPVATIPLGKNDKPVRFVLPASSLKTLMQSGSTNLYDHIKAITTALQKQTNPNSTEEPPRTVTQQNVTPAAPCMPTTSAVPYLMPPIIGQMGRPAFRMNAPFSAPGPRLGGVRVRLPRFSVPPVAPPIVAPTSSGLKVRLPRLGGLKSPDIPKLDDTPLSPPPFADANQYPNLKSPTGTSSIDAINAVIQKVARSMKPDPPPASRSILKQQPSTSLNQVVSDVPAGKAASHITVAATVSPPKRLRQKTAVKKSKEVDAALSLKAEKTKLGQSGGEQGNTTIDNYIPPAKSTVTAVKLTQEIAQPAGPQNKVTSKAVRVNSQPARPPQNLASHAVIGSSGPGGTRNPWSITASVEGVPVCSTITSTPLNIRPVVSVFKPAQTTNVVQIATSSSSSSSPTLKTLGQPVMAQLKHVQCAFPNLVNAVLSSETKAVPTESSISSPTAVFKKEVTAVNQQSKTRAALNVPQVIISHSEPYVSSDSETKQRILQAGSPTKKSAKKRRQPERATTPKEGVKEETRAKLQSLLSKNLAEKLKPPTPSDEPLAPKIPESKSNSKPKRKPDSKGSKAKRTPKTVTSGKAAPATAASQTSPVSSMTKILTGSLATPTSAKADEQNSPAVESSLETGAAVTTSVKTALQRCGSEEIAQSAITPVSARPTSKKTPLPSVISSCTPVAKTVGTAKESLSAGNASTPVKKPVKNDTSVQDKIKQMLIAGGLAKSDTPIKFNIPVGLNLSGLKFNVVTASEARKLGLFQKKGSAEGKSDEAAGTSRNSESTPSGSKVIVAPMASTSNSGIDTINSSAGKKKSSEPAASEDEENEDKLPQYDGAADECPQPKKRKKTKAKESKEDTEKLEEVSTSVPAASSGVSEEPMNLETPKSSEGTGSHLQVNEKQSSAKQTSENSTVEENAPKRMRRRRGDPKLSPVEIPSISFQSLDRVNIIPRPWIKPDGDVNEIALCNMMEAVLMYLMNKPGATFATIISKYKSVLQPIALMEILQTLELIGCVRSMWITCNQECSLFSQRPEYTVGTNGNIQNSTFLPIIDCPSKMGHFKSLLRGKSTK